MFSTIPQLIADLAAAKMVILVDAPDRENEGDLVLLADFVTPEALNFMSHFARGLICLALTEERCAKLAIPLMVQENTAAYGTNFTVSIEAAEGVTTGISVADRARTIRVAVSEWATPKDLVRPGHVFPLMAQKGGVLSRAGHTEAACDLAFLSGRSPAAVICEVLKADGSVARVPDLLKFAGCHGLRIGAISHLINFIKNNSTNVCIK